MGLWIEMIVQYVIPYKIQSASAMGLWIEMMEAVNAPVPDIVSLCDGAVD